MIAAFGTIADVVALLSASSGFDRFDFRNFFCSRAPGTYLSSNPLEQCRHQ